MAEHNQPLLTGTDAEPAADPDYRGGSLADCGKTPDAAPGWFVWLLTLSAGLSGLLFGYDTGVISATLVSVGSSLSQRELTSLDKSLITSSTALLALIVSPCSSILADSFGRKHVILLADVLFILGSIVQTASWTVGRMVAGRAVVGAAIGAASFVVPLYIAELAPAAHRGRLVTTNVLFITLGQVIAYVVGWAFAEYGSESTGWRWMVFLGAVPAALQSVLLLFMPETPRWLVKARRSAEALQVIRSVMGSSGSARCAEATLKDIEMEVRDEEEARRLSRHEHTSGRWTLLDQFRELLATRRNRRALAIACLLQGLQQLCGFNSLMYYSATIFTILGFSTPTLTSLVVAVTNFVFTAAALLLIDRIGRRRALLCSMPFMTAGLLASAYGFSYIPLSSANSGAGTPATAPAHGAAVLVLVSIAVYVAAYATGLGNVPWMQSELFQLSVRSVGSGIATATNWGANLVVGLTFLPLMEALSPPWTFALYGMICVVGEVLIWRVYPETTGLSLEEVASLLEDD